MKYPVEVKELEKLKKKIRRAVQKSFSESEKEYKLQVKDLTKMLKEQLTWGEFKLLVDAINEFIKSYE